METSEGFLSQSGLMFPVLRTAEITEVCAQLNFDITKDELIEPNHHKEKIRQLFVILLGNYMGQTEEDLQPTEAMKNYIREHTAYPTLHQEPGDLMFYLALRDMLNICGYSQFSWKDLYSPTSKRLRYQLSAVINFARFSEDQLKVYEEMCEPRAELLQALEEVNFENEQLCRQLGETEQSSQSESAELQIVMHECHELEQEIARHNRLQATARKEAATLKQQANDLKDEIASTQWALEESQAEIPKLQAQIVNNSEAKQQDLLEKQRILSKEKENCKSLENSLTEHQTKVCNVQQATKDVQATYSVLLELESQYKKFQSMQEQLEVTQQKISEQNKIHSKLSDESVEAERQLLRLEEAYTHQRKQHNMQSQAVQEAFDMARSQLGKAEQDRREALSRIQAGEAEVKALQQAMQVEHDKAKQDLEKLIEEYKVVEKSYLDRDRQRILALRESENVHD